MPLSNTVVEILLENLAQNIRSQAVYVGDNWVLSLISAEDGTQYAGTAAAPRYFSDDSHFPIGHYSLDEDATKIAESLRSEDASEASVALATINALLQIEKIPVTEMDAVDWLKRACTDKKMAIFGRFPFINDELRPFASQVWVFELNPHEDEYSSADIPEIVPEADIVAITGGTIINHTLDNILAHTRSDSTVAILGPSTVLSPALFKHGIDALFGVQVVDIQKAIDSVQAGAIFRKMQGLRRVSLFKEL